MWTRFVKWFKKGGKETMIDIGYLFGGFAVIAWFYITAIVVISIV